LEYARAVIVTFDDDGDNMLAIMMAKKLNPRLKVITIINNQELEEGAKAAQADVVIAPSDLMGQILAMSVISDDAAGLFISERLKGKRMAEFEIKREHVKLEEIEKISPVLLIIRKGTILSNVGKEFQIEKGDIVYALTDHESMDDLRAFIDGKRK
jgi:Trk K+ transport system NAD-binding subunit